MKPMTSIAALSALTILLAACAHERLGRDGPARRRDAGTVRRPGHRRT